MFIICIEFYKRTFELLCHPISSALYHFIWFKNAKGCEKQERSSNATTIISLEASKFAVSTPIIDKALQQMNYNEFE
jgi:hypothetical protein